MIYDRPKHLVDQAAYIHIPTVPFQVSWNWIPEPIRFSLASLGGIQPITGNMAELAEGILKDEPSDAEVQHFSEINAEFQVVFLVLSLAMMDGDNDKPTGIPYAISIIPASKRNDVTIVDVHSIKARKGDAALHSTDWAYSGFDPFIGEWEMFSQGAVILDMKSGKGYIDELGVVLGMYYLRTEYKREEVAEFDAFLPDERSRKRFLRNRINQIYKPFKRLEARRIWGTQTPIELFLYQELLYRGLKPELQRLVYPDGRTYPSLYDAYSDIELRHELQIVTEVDIFFPEERLAVFCDGSHHFRRKQQEKDAKIDGILSKLGIESVRVSGREIMEDLKTAADAVCNRLDELRGTKPPDDGS